MAGQDCETSCQNLEPESLLLLCQTDFQMQLEGWKSLPLREIEIQGNPRRSTSVVSVGRSMKSLVGKLGFQ